MLWEQHLLWSQEQQVLWEQQRPGRQSSRSIQSSRSRSSRSGAFGAARAMDGLMAAASAVTVPGAGGAGAGMLGDEAQARAAIMGDGAARMGEGFAPGFSDPSDDPDGGEVPDDVWASDEFQDKMWTWMRQAAGPAMSTETERKIQYVRPAKGFAFKTVDKAGGKVFVNVCASPQVPKPPEITEAMLQEDQCRVRIPLSMGAPREDADKEGKECTVYDAIMHSEVVERAKTEKAMKEFVVELCLQWIEQKHELMLRRPVRFPKGLQAKGEPEIQTIRRNTNHMVAEVGEKAYEPQAPEPVEEPEYSIEAEDERVVVVVAVPRLDSAEGVSLEHSSRRLFLKADGAYALTVMLPHSVEKTGADCEFNKAEKTLTVWLRRVMEQELEEETKAPEEQVRSAAASHYHRFIIVCQCGSDARRRFGQISARRPSNALVMELD